MQPRTFRPQSFRLRPRYILSTQSTTEVINSSILCCCVCPSKYRHRRRGLGVMTVSTQSRECISILRSILSALSESTEHAKHTSREQIDDDSERFSLWVGNIGALHPPASPLSLESRLRYNLDLLEYTSELLNDFSDVSTERELFLKPLQLYKLIAFWHSF